MAELPLNSLRIENFRGIKELEIDRLAQINLLVGKNSVGKTTVLDAIRLYASGTNLSAVFRLLADRNEIDLLSLLRFSREEPNTIDIEQEFIDAFREIFFGRPKIGISSFHSYIGEKQKPYDKKLELSLIWGKDSQPALPLSDLPENDLNFVLKNYMGEQFYPLNILELEKLRVIRPSSFLNQNSVVKHQFIPSGGLSTSTLEKLWNPIALTSLETEIINVLKIIIPELEQINFVESTPQRFSKRTIIAKVNGERVALVSLGEGLNRLLTIALATVNAQNGILLIDEIESGLHYSVQVPMWRILLELAHRLNVQIFATTHSEDTTQAFQITTSENNDVEGLLFRLEKYGENSVKTTYDEKRLEKNGGVGVR